MEYDIRKWIGQKNIAYRRINYPNTRLAQRQSDLENTLTEHILDRERADLYTVIFGKCKVNIAGFKQ